ncbi:MAG TPA: hypothetical protein VHB73_07065, partial [Alphaproteobacteria bacterium]|nr:hypothetical protein [Alphaproteobacteria bacterium]
QDVSEAADAPFTPGLQTIAPFAPVHVSGARNASDDVAISWMRRARKNAEWLDYIDVPLDEEAEIYDVEILDGATVVRSFEGLTSAEATYTAAEQAADFGSAQAAVDVKVYQISSRYGRGAAASATV